MTVKTRYHVQLISWTIAYGEKACKKEHDGFKHATPNYLKEALISG